MLTKGYIVELATKTSNKYKVRIPLFDSAGQDTLTNNDNIVEATLCYIPGNLNGYKVGDCVFVEFENDEESKPVILGRLFTNDSGEEFRGLEKIDSLNVSNIAKLPLNSTIGEVSAQTLIDNLKLSKVNSERIDQISSSEDISKLEKQVETNTSSIESIKGSVETNANNITTINKTITISTGEESGYVYNDNGVSEMGQYIDFHTDKSGINFTTRLAAASYSNGNLLTLPKVNGTIAITDNITSATKDLPTKSDVSSAISTATSGLASTSYVDTKISEAIKTTLNTSV